MGGTISSCKSWISAAMSIPGALLLLVALATSGQCTDNCYDHQTVDYKTSFSPVECGQQCSVTPFFSPDHSVNMYLDLIESATESIDIYTPGKKCMYMLLTSCNIHNFYWLQHLYIHVHVCLPCGLNMLCTTV